MKEIKVSVGMPVYNGEKYLAGAIESILTQNFKDFELIISDNASTDKTSLICNEYLRKDNRVKYYRSETNRGTIFNFNRVLELAKGEYFMWAAHDDKWEPDFISTLLSRLENFPEHVLAFCGFDVFNDSGDIVYKQHRNWGTYFNRSRLTRMLSMIFVHYSTQKACIIYGLMRKEYISTDGGMCANYKGESQGCDIVTLFRLLSRGPFIFINQILFHYNYREAPDYQKKRCVDFSKQDSFFKRVAKNLAQLKIEILYKPLDDNYYKALKEVVKYTQISFIEKILLNMAITIEKYIEPSKIYNIFFLYFRSVIKRLDKCI